MRDLGKTAVHFEIKPTTIKTGEAALSKDTMMKSLADEFEKFLTTQQYPEKKILLNLGLHYIHKIEEQEKKP